MKYIKSIVLGAFVALTSTACTDWLDVNTSPNTPSAESSLIQNRLPWCQFYLNDAYEIAASRTVYSHGLLTSINRGANPGWSSFRDGNSSIWYPVGGLTTTAYQWFFVGCGSNLEDMYEKAMEQGAWHYAGAAKFMRAYGFMMMHELHGEMPYTQALGSDATPAYDNGKTIYLGCLAEIDEAIELFSKTQDADVVALSVGDTWNGGSADKWLKACYLMKARWCNNLSKKANGSYKEGKYDEATILDCISKAQASIEDNTWVDHLDVASTSTDVLGWGEPLIMSRQYSVQGMSENFRATKMTYDNLTNFAGNGVEDPRADKLLAWARSRKSADTPAEIKWSEDGLWRRTLGADMQKVLAPYAISFDKETSSWFCDTEDVERLNDTVYVQILSGAKGGKNPTESIFWCKDLKNNKSATTGTFYNRPSSPNYIATYHEALFIKAEVLFNKGDKAGAYAAYKAGVKASIDMMNKKLNVWIGENDIYKGCPSMEPMTQTEIDNFLEKGIGTQAELTLGHIMTQKSIAMFYSVQSWNDARRYDYDSNVFFGWKIPAQHGVVAAAKNCIPEDKQWRRWAQCGHETNYNIENLNAIGAEVPGANTNSDSWNQELDVWSIPVWFDSTQE